MTNPELTEIVCILDRSGSMESICDDAIGGFNAFLQEQKAESGQATLTVVLFDNEYKLLYEGRDIQAVKPLDRSTYQPRGATALLDAIGTTVDRVGKRLADTPQDRRPGKVIVAILTDGQENDSHRYSHRQVFDMIRHQRQCYQWEFVFLAANQNAIATGTSLCIDQDSSFDFEASGAGVAKAYTSISRIVSVTRGKKKSGSSGGGGKKGGGWLH